MPQEQNETYTTPMGVKEISRNLINQNVEKQV